MIRCWGSIRGHSIFISITRLGLGFDKIWIRFSPSFLLPVSLKVDAIGGFLEILSVQPSEQTNLSTVFFFCFFNAVCSSDCFWYGVWEMFVWCQRTQSACETLHEAEWPGPRSRCVQRARENASGKNPKISSCVWLWCTHARTRAHVCACMRACVRAYVCVRACTCVCSEYG